jgi:hypothetical protein
MNQSSRWKQRPPGSNWGDFGPDDQYGRMNLLTPEKVKQGIAEVKEGITFNLSLPLDFPGSNVLNPRRHPPVLRPTVRNGEKRTPVIIQPRDYNRWLAADLTTAHEMMSCNDMPLLQAAPQPRVSL